MRLLAIDLSLTDTGCVRPDGSISHVEWSPIPKHKGKMTRAMVRELHENRLSGACIWLSACIGAGLDAIVIEGYSFGSRDGKAFDRAEIRGVMRRTAVLAEVPFIEVDPAAIKTFATGAGNAGKPAMLAEAIRRLDYDGSNENEVDALWLWHLTHQYLNSPEAEASGLHLPQAHLKALVGKIHDIDWQGLRDG